MNFKHKYVFLFPGLFVLIGILIFPIIFVIRLSLSGWNSYNGLNFIGLENYVRLFTDDPRFWQSFFRLSFLSVTTVILQYVIGFALAHMVWKDIKFQRFFRVLFSNSNDDHTCDHDCYLENFFSRVFRSC